LRFIEGELKYYRQRRRLVLHAYTLFAPDTTASQTPVYNVKGTHGADPCPPFNPLPGEIIIEKQFDSAFMQTQLEHILKELGVHQLSIAGVETHGSIIATAKDARSNGLHVIVPDMCVADSDHALHLQALRSMQTQAI
jgi:nicotinamidase-related amidase